MTPEVPAQPSAQESDLQSPKAPEPTYAPFLLAMGITMLFWGLATSPVMSAGGFALFIWAASIWIRQLAQSWKDEHESEN